MRPRSRGGGLSLVFKSLADGFGGFGGLWSSLCLLRLLPVKAFFYLLPQPATGSVHAWERRGRPRSIPGSGLLSQGPGTGIPPARASGPPCRAPPLPLFTPPPTPGNFARARSNFIWESRSVAVATTLTSEGLGPEIPRKGGGVEEGRPREGLSLTLHAPAPSGRWQPY